jgi:titin
MRTYIWTRDINPAPVTEMRDNLTTVVRAALLDHPALKDVPRFEHCDPKIEEETMTEEFSDLTLLKGDRYLAGAYIGYNLTVSETIGRAPLVDSLAYTFAVDVEQIEKTANAPTLLIASAGNQEASLRWKAPTWFGGVDPIDWYQIEQSIDGGETWTMAVSNTGSKLPSYTVTGLTNGQEYLFRVSAVNSFGVGATSASSNAVTPAV